MSQQASAINKHLQTFHSQKTITHLFPPTNRPPEPRRPNATSYARAPGAETPNTGASMTERRSV